MSQEGCSDEDIALFSLSVDEDITVEPHAQGPPGNWNCLEDLCLAIDECRNVALVDSAFSHDCGWNGVDSEF